MKHVFKSALVLTTVFFLYTATAYSDTVWLQNDDRLVGTVQDDHFALQAPYGQIVVRGDFLKTLAILDTQLVNGSLHTLNNDRFSGVLLNKKIHILLEDKAEKVLDLQDIKEIFFDTDAQRKQQVTTVFTMNNNDRFSGQLLTGNVTIRTGDNTLTFTHRRLNRLEFLPGTGGNVSLLSTSGDLVRGQLLIDSIRIAPDSIAPLAINTSAFKVIQLNSRKLLASNYRKLAPAERDSDGDGVPNPADACGGTPWGVPIDKNGCSKQTAPLQTLATKTQSQQPGNPAIPDILFDFDSEKIKPRYYPLLDGIIAALKTNPALKIKIGGHTDNAGPEKYNQDLSEKRARTAKQYMIDRGIAAQRITAVGYGSTRNIASNENVSGRVLNRRVNVVWIK